MYLLLVDYGFLSSSEIQEMLEQSPEDTDIINCFSAATLLKIADKLSPDIIIIDFALVQDKLPELFSDLRKKSGDAHVLALIDPGYYEKLYEAIEAGGVDDYLVKPIRKEDFLTRVQIAAKRKKSGAGPAKHELPGGEQENGQLYDFDSHKSKSKTDLDQDLFAGSDMPEIIDEKDPLQQEDTAGPFSEASFDSSGEEDAFAPDEEKEFSGPETEDEEEFIAYDDLEFLSEGEFASEEQPESEAEASDTFSFDDIKPGKPAEDPEDEKLISETEGADLDEAGYGLFGDLPESGPVEGDSEESVEDFAEESEEQPPEEDLPGLFDEGVDLKPEGKGSTSGGESFQSFEDIIAGAPEEDKWDLPVVEDQKPGLEEYGPDVVKPAAEFLGGDQAQDIPQEKPRLEPRSQPGDERIFDDLFDEEFRSAEETEKSDSGQEGGEEPFFLQDEDPDWGTSTRKERPEEESTGHDEKRRDLREIASLQGESADDFLFGTDSPDSNNFEEDAFEESAEKTDDREQKPEKRGRSKKRKSGGSGLSKFLSVFGNVVFVLLLLLMATLSFFLIQSRVSGGVPQVAGYQMYIVLSGSMSPEFDTGSLAFVREVETDQLGIGDIITYRSQAGSDSLTTHRIVEVQRNDSTRFITRGDANTVNDPNPVLAENVVGEVRGSVPYIGYLLNFVQTRQGLILLIFVPGVLIILYELGKIMKYLTGGENGKKKKSDRQQSRLAEE